MAASDQVNWQSPLTGLLSSILGGETQQDLNKDETGTATGTQNVTGTQTNNQNTTQNSNTNTSTTGQQTNAGTVATTGANSQTQQGSSVQSSNADISALQEVYARQKAGITPEMLSAIFSEGAKKQPQLITSYANAVGARASENTPLATSLRDLQTNLTTQAATMNNQLLSDSSQTAARIAELTKALTTTQNNTTTGTNTQTQDSNSTQNSTQQQQQQQLANTVQNGTTANNQTTNSNSTTGSHVSQNVDESKTVDKDTLKLLAGLGIGGSVLDSLLGGNGSNGGLAGLAALITGQGGGGGQSGTGQASQTVGLLQQLINLGKGLNANGPVGAGGGSIDSTGSTNDSNPDLNGSVGDPLLDESGTNLFEVGTQDWYDASLQELGINPATLADFSGSTDLSWLDDIANGTGDWADLGGGNLIDSVDWGDYTEFGYANGGLIEAVAGPNPRLTAGPDTPSAGRSSPGRGRAAASQASKEQQARITAIQKLKVFQQMKADPKGRLLLQIAERQRRASVPGANNAQGDVGGTAANAAGTAPNAPTAQSAAVGNAIGNAAGAFTINAVSPLLIPIMKMLNISVPKSIQSQAISGIMGMMGMGGATGTGPSGNAAQGSVSTSGMSTVGPDGTVGPADGTGTQGFVSISNEGDANSAASGGVGDSGGGVGVGSVGTASGSDNSTGNDGSDGADGGDSGASGWSHGGEVPASAASAPDPMGILDTVDAKLSIGEFVNSKDVVDALGTDFFRHLQDRYHVPADMQQAMGVMQ